MAGAAFWKLTRRVTLQPEWLQAVLLGVGTMVAAGTFWFKDIYEPAVTPATLNISPALQELYARWHTQAEALKETLREIGDQMRQAAAEYEANEAANTSRFRV